MEFLYSEEINPSLYETHGLDVGFPLRRHKQRFLEVDGTLRAHRDWTKLVGPVDGYKGGLHDDYGFVCVTVPECLPDRLEIISYSNEYAFLYDDAMEVMMETAENGSPNDLLATFGKNVLDAKVGANAQPEKQLQAQILQEMMDLDPKRAVVTMKAWAKFVQLASQTRSTLITTLKEFIPARTIDAGELFWFGVLTFGMGLTIPEHEYDICMELARPGYIALGLANDLYSWEKERDAAKNAGQDDVFNAIWVIMTENSVGEDEAKEICRQEIKHYASHYLSVVEETKENTNLSKDTRVYVEAVMRSYIGNLVWSICCPRYKVKGANY